MRILITGFEPFGGEDLNSSQDTVKAVACDNFNDIEVVTGILPVSFKRSCSAICELINENEPDVLIMLGQSGKNGCIKIERVALNLIDSAKGDNDGYAPKIRDCLIQAGIPAKTSNSAGLYVCNQTYFTALHYIATAGSNTKALFIHLPSISEEWPIERMKTAIANILIDITDLCCMVT